MQHHIPTGEAYAQAPAVSLCAREPAPEVHDAEEYAALAFFSVEGIGPSSMAKLKEAFGSLAAALQAPREKVKEHLLAVGQRGLDSVPSLEALADKHLARARLLGLSLLFPGRPGWPRQLAGLDFPPLLYLKGRLLPEQRRVAIVGSRETDDEGLTLTTRLSQSLAAAGVSVVSGAAHGIDRAAHEACLRAGSPTVAVFGCGLDLVYPPENEALLEAVLDRGGGWVSHFPPGTAAQKQNFQVRNRVIAHLSDATVVTRAKWASGAISTAEAAHKAGRRVFALPGDLSQPLCAGSNALLDRGVAEPAYGAQVVAEAVGVPLEVAAFYPPDTPAARAAPAAVRHIKVEPPAPLPLADVPPDLLPIFQALGTAPVQFENLLQSCRVDAPRLAEALLRLEVMGLAKELEGKYFIRLAEFRGEAGKSQ